MPPTRYVLTKVNEEGFVNNDVYVSSDIHDVIEVLVRKIRKQYASDRNARNMMIEDINTGTNEIMDTLEQNNYYSVSGPDEVNFEINVFREGSNVNNANNANTSNNAPLRPRPVERPAPLVPMLPNNFVNNEEVLEDPEMGPISGGKRRTVTKAKKTRKARKTRKAKKSKKSKKTRKH